MTASKQNSAKHTLFPIYLDYGNPIDVWETQDQMSNVSNDKLYLLNQIVMCCRSPNSYQNEILVTDARAFKLSKRPAIYVNRSYSVRPYHYLLSILL